LLLADDQPRFHGFGGVRRDGSRAAWEGNDNQTLKDIGIPDETEHAGEPQNRRSGQRDALEPSSRYLRLNGEAEARQGLAPLLRPPSPNPLIPSHGTT
jgi:hypothetical protein